MLSPCSPTDMEQPIFYHQGQFSPQSSCVDIPETFLVKVKHHQKTLDKQKKTSTFQKVQQMQAKALNSWVKVCIQNQTAHRVNWSWKRLDAYHTIDSHYRNMLNSETTTLPNNHWLRCLACHVKHLSRTFLNIYLHAYGSFP